MEKSLFHNENNRGQLILIGVNLSLIVTCIILAFTVLVF